MDTSIISQMSTNLTVAYAYIIVSSVLCIIGYAVIIGIVWIGIWLWKWAIIIIREQYGNYLSVWAETKPGKKVKA